MHNSRDDDKGAEEYNLDEQADEDDYLAYLAQRRSVRSHKSPPPPSALQEERKQVSDDEDFRNAGRTDRGCELAAQNADYAAEGHVNGRGEAGGRDEEEEGLSNVH